MANIDNIKLWTSPITGKIELVSVNAKNTVTARRTLSESEIYDYLVQLIEYMRIQGANFIKNTKTGEKWTFGKDYEL